jgi:hypothetical protein
MNLLSALKPDVAPVSAPSIFFQIVLTLSLLAIGLYAVALRRRIAALGNTAAMVTMAAMVLVWRPDFATSIAKAVGVGRGVDLIFYCWVIISLVMILNLHFRIRSQTEQMTELVRRMTLDHPVAEGKTRMTKPESPNEIPMLK